MSGIPHYLINTEARTFVQTQKELHKRYTYYTNAIVENVSQDFGGITPSYHIDPVFDGRYTEVAIIREPESRADSSLVGRVPKTANSVIYEAAKQKLTLNIQLHFGKCSNPTVFNEFDSSLVLEDVQITNYSASQLGAMSASDVGLVTESSNISIGTWYYIHKLIHHNIGLPIIQAGYTPISMDVLSTDNDAGCILFVLAYNTTSPTSVPMRVYFSQDRGKVWQYLALPTQVYSSSTFYAKQTTLSAFEDYLYVHAAVDTGSYPTSLIASISIKDLLSLNNGWAVVSEGTEYDHIQSTDRIVKFKNQYYAAYFRDFSMAAIHMGRVVRFGTTIGNHFEGVYYNNVTDTSTPFYLVNYQDKLLFTGMYMYPPDSNEHQLLIAYTEDGTTWFDVPLQINGVPVKGSGEQFVYVIPITDCHWKVFVYKANGTNLAYVTTDKGQNWQTIQSAFKGEHFAPFYAPTQNILFTPTQRSYDGGITAVPLPDHESEHTYATYTNSYPTGTGTALVRCFGCNNDPNLMFTYGYDGVHMFA